MYCLANNIEENEKKIDEKRRTRIFYVTDCTRSSPRFTPIFNLFRESISKVAADPKHIFDVLASPAPTGPTERRRLLD